MKTYRVQAFAQVAGVSVRALHHYDAINLLKPSRRTAAGHRRYTDVDLVRLQQIVVLQHIGFSLSEIRELLDRPDYDLRQALAMQQSAIDMEIQRLQQVSAALQDTLAAIDATGKPDTKLVIAMLHMLSADENWTRRFFSDEAWMKVQPGRSSVGDALQGAAQWSQLTDDFREVCHLPPTHPDVQVLAAQMHTLIEAFTQRDAQVEASLREMYSDLENIPPMYRMDEHLHEFMNQALNAYRTGCDNS